MAITDKQISNALVDRVGEHELVKVELEAWVIPGCERAVSEAINKALTGCVFVSDWGSPEISGHYPDGDKKILST